MPPVALNSVSAALLQTFLVMSHNLLITVPVNLILMNLFCVLLSGLGESVFCVLLSDLVKFVFCVLLPDLEESVFCALLSDLEVYILCSSL